VGYFIDAPPRLGRSQGATLFWGLISVCFAAGACYFFWKNNENQRLAEKWQDQGMQLQDQIDKLQGEKAHLQDGLAEQETQVKAREDLVQEKETELAAEELRVEGLATQRATIAAQNQAQVAMVKKFNDAIKKLGGATPPDVVERSGRPVLRVPNAQLFPPGDAALTPDGKALLNQISQTIVGNMDTFELRVVCYTDTGGEAAPDAPKKDADAAHTAAWDLTSARATVLSRYFRDESQLPFLNVTVSARGDAEPIAANAGDERVKNRRVEIGVTPLPVPFHAPDADKAAGDPSPGATDAAATGTTTPKKKKPKTPATPATPGTPTAAPVGTPATPQ
jgi:outer membrane protein OmpA-like peptidoglycan-associated protein